MLTSGWGAFNSRGSGFAPARLPESRRAAPGLDVRRLLLSTGCMADNKKTWQADDVLELGRSYQSAALLAAAADLDLFGVLGRDSLTAGEVTQRLDSDLRGTTILLDALASIGLLRKAGDAYSAPEELRTLLGSHGPGSVLGMTQHQANCLRRWSRIADVVKAGRRLEGGPSIRGEEGDHAAFIEAMDNLASTMAADVVAGLRDIEFRHLLDVGGASGSYTMAFLRQRGDCRATLFDLPPVIPMAERRLAEAGLLERVRLVPGDYLEDPLPEGCDFAWLSAIVHQNSREQNRALFRRVSRALAPGGRVAIRDIVMEPSRVEPVAGAVFAVNMLVGTEGGGTFTLEETREDLEAAGFEKVRLLHRDPGMNSIVVAEKAEALQGSLSGS